ncbi:MAG: hypothetical protein IKS96_07125 [Fibrobacter sp.]|nr:hypothetical protein [Fibrobacter sp.]MBR6449699.1 hypothetical protein [Fibrobacter sp.]
MKKIAVVAVCVFTALSFAAGNKCNYDRAILNFEKRMDLVSAMKGAEVKKIVPDEGALLGNVLFKKLSKPLKSGQFMGLSQGLIYSFDNKCVLKLVVASKVEPDTRKTIKKTMIHLREDGNLKASCLVDDYAKGIVWRENPVTEMIEPNPKCVCYDRRSFERPFGKYGCMDEEQIEFMKERNSDPCAGSTRCKLEREIRKSGAQVEVRVE